MKTRILLLSILIGLFSLHIHAQISEETKQAMFCASFENKSTAPNYVVCKVKDLHTGNVKEICCEAPFLRGSVRRETGKNIDCQNNTTRYFEFSIDSALWNISFNLYTEEELNNYAKTLNVDKIIKDVKSGEMTSQTFMGARKEQIMFAHIMINNGIMVTRGCEAGNICYLQYFTKN